MLNGETEVIGRMPPPWNGSSVSQTDSGAPCGRVVVGVNTVDINNKTIMCHIFDAVV